MFDNSRQYARRWWTSVKGSRRLLKTSAKNRAKDWHKSLIFYRKKKSLPLE